MSAALFGVKPHYLPVGAVIGCQHESTQFDLALSRVARARYISGKAAIPYPDVTTGG